MSGRITLDAPRRSRRRWIGLVLGAALLVGACGLVIWGYAWMATKLIEASKQAIEESGIEFHMPACKNDGSFEICRDTD